jgi:hypothetical protein
MIESQVEFAPILPRLGFAFSKKAPGRNQASKRDMAWRGFEKRSSTHIP